jgi:hypothetical protein
VHYDKACAGRQDPRCLFSAFLSAVQENNNPRFLADDGFDERLGKN